MPPSAPAPSPAAEQAMAGMPIELLVALVGLAGVVLTIAVGYWQWRRGQARVEEADRKRLELEDRLARDRTEWEESRHEERAWARRAREAAQRAVDLRRAADDYRALIIEDLRSLKILDMSKPLDLEALYVHLQVREEESPRFASPEEMEPLAQGSPERLLQLSAKQALDAQASAMRPEDALRRFGRFVVLGDPGAGKTTMLRHLALRIARGEITPALTLPIYVELREFVDSGMGDIVAYAAHACERRYGFTGALDHLHEQLAAGHAALLLDGLDEVLGGGSAEEAERAYRLVAGEVDRISARFRAAPIAVTCRRAGWQGGLRAFQTLDVLDFSWPQIETFVGNWFGADGARADGLKAALRANARIQGLAANPLILSLIAIVYERDLELPERRAELYNRCVEVLLKEWDAHRGIRRFSQFTTDRKRDLLEEIGFHFHSRGLRYFPEEELLSVIAEFLPTIDVGPEHARAILDEIAAQYGLLKVQANGWYGFLHLTLQEYFAAVAANERGAEAVAYVVAYRHDPWWEEVLLLLAGRAADASGLLLGVLGREPTSTEPPAEGEPLAVDDDIVHGDLLLAARCLTTAPRVRVPWLRPAIIDATLDYLRTVPSESACQRAAETLVAIGGRALLDRLVAQLRDQSLQPWRRVYVAEALGGSGSAHVGAALTALLPDLDVTFVASHVIHAIRRLEYHSAAPALLSLLEHMMEHPDWHRPSLVKAVVALGGDEGVEHVLRLVDDPDRDDLPRVVLIESLALARDQRTGELLLDRIDQAPPVLVGALAWATLGILGAASAPDVLDRLLRRENADWRLITTYVRDAFRGKACPALVEPLVAAIADAGRPPAVRWSVAAILDEYPKSVDALLPLLTGHTGDDWTVRCAATVLGHHQQDAARPVLRATLDALIRNDVDPLWGLGADATAPRVASALAALNDEAWAQGRLLTLVNRDRSPSSPRTREEHALLAALHHTDVNRIADVLARYVDDALADLLPFDLMRLSCPALVPHLFEILDRPQEGSGSELLKMIADAVDDLAYVPNLLALYQNHDLRGGVIDALDALSRRCQVRIFEDGRIFDVKTPAKHR